MKTQFVTDTNGEKIAVILPIKDYEKLMDELEELQDVKAYDKAKNRKQTFMEAEEMFKAIDQKRQGH
jgi:PHD/YefM family antitoxin component YafN of YafNO toxin-antitoxin module